MAGGDKTAEHEDSNGLEARGFGNQVPDIMLSLSAVHVLKETRVPSGPPKGYHFRRRATKEVIERSRSPSRLPDRAEIYSPSSRRRRTAPVAEDESDSDIDGSNDDEEDSEVDLSRLFEAFVTEYKQSEIDTLPDGKTLTEASVEMFVSRFEGNESLWDRDSKTRKTILNEICARLPSTASGKKKWKPLLAWIMKRHRIHLPQPTAEFPYLRVKSDSVLHQALDENDDTNPMRYTANNSLTSYLLRHHYEEMAEIVDFDLREDEETFFSVSAHNKPALLVQLMPYLRESPLNDFKMAYFEGKYRFDKLTTLVDPRTEESLLHIATDLLVEKPATVSSKGSKSLADKKVKSPEEKTAMRLAVQKELVVKYLLHVAPDLVAQECAIARPGNIDESKKEKMSAYRLRAKKLRERDGEEAVLNDEILYELKSRIMQRKQKQEINDLLYGRQGDAEKEIYLNLIDLEGDDTPADKVSLMQILEDSEFEDVLRYVGIPRDPFGSLLGRKRRKKDSSGAEQDANPGRDDFKQIFALLKSKGVRKIINLEVRDDEAFPHRDECIEEIGRMFQIEVWNWEKRDICSTVVANAAPLVKELYLYANDKRAVLRGWCDSREGFCSERFPELERVHLKLFQTRESYERCEAYANEFKARMESFLNPQYSAMSAGYSNATSRAMMEYGTFPGRDTHEDERVSVKLVALEKSQNDASQADILALRGDSIMNTDTWTNTMRRFIKALEKVMSARGGGEKSESINTDYTPVRIAIIDDGFDKCRLLDSGLLGPKVSTQRRDIDKVKGTSFLVFNDEETPEASRPYYFSTSGHGTLMAAIVKKMCPWAKLYLVRLNTGAREDAILQPTAESAAKAIQWAVRQKVDIISMSFSTTTDSPELANAVSLARDKKILMFAASGENTTDAGLNKVFPASSNGVIRISAYDGATVEGRGEQPAGENNFSFPGGSDKVLNSIFDSKELDIFTSRLKAAPNSYFSSSFATALAAAFAGLIMHCLKLKLRVIDESSVALKNLHDFNKYMKFLKKFTPQNSIYVSNLTQMFDLTDQKNSHSDGTPQQYKQRFAAKMVSLCESVNAA